MSPRSMMTVPACSSVQTPLPWAAAGTGADKAHNAGTIDERGKWDVHLGQARLDIRRGLWEAITQLGHLVEIASATQRARLQKPELLQQDRHR